MGAICRQTFAKYNRRQIINHVKAKHAALKSALRTRAEIGTHIEKGDDGNSQMGNGYGRIRTARVYNERLDDVGRILDCARCGYGNPTKDGIKRHMSRRNEIGGI